MKRPRTILLVVAAAAVVGLAAVVVRGLIRETPPVIEQCRVAERVARMSPDYADVTVPPNIAPLNFTVREEGSAYFARVSGPAGRPVETLASSPGIRFPLDAWRRLLGANRGATLALDVCVRDASGVWTRFGRASIVVAREDIDPYLVYREMPVYNLAWTDMGVYQRCIENFDVSVVLHNGSYEHGCMNCHTFLANRTDRMAMNVRAPTGGGGPPGGLLIAENGVVTRVVDTQTPFSSVPAIYLAWHPSGRAIAFSVNKILQCFHTVGNHRDTFDTFSDLAIYRLDTNTITTNPVVSRPDRTETYPAWSPDGRWLYFCSAPQLPVDRYREVRYDLMRVRYDLDNDAWGTPEMVLSAAAAGLSISHPRISPDGRFLLCCMTEFGNFPAFSPSSDLYLIDFEKGDCHRLEINSPESDAYHSWSSNSRWIVFSSKRRDGVFAMPYFSHVDANGRAAKPFLLPQEDPGFYDANIRVNNLPELVKEPVPLTNRAIAAALYDKTRAMKAKLDPRVPPAPEPGKTAPAGPYVE